jgi:MoaA/NifB/PqqE/SkfB family radical SAM enzyme
MKDTVRKATAALVRLSWRAIPRSLYLGSVPNVVFLALTRRCNINCVFCPYQYLPEDQRMHMPDDLFAKVAQDIGSANVRRVMLSPNLGEPFMAPRFLDKVRELRRRGVRHIEATTNASLLHKVGILETLRDGPDVINLSFPGFDREMYERDVRVKLYDHARSNVLDILRQNQALGRPRTINLWLRGDLGIDRMMDMPEMEEAKQLASSMGAMTEVDDWLGYIKQEDLPQGYVIQRGKAALKERPCTLLFNLTIHPDGDIHLCGCRNIFGDPELRIGNLRDMSILEAHRRIPLILERWECRVFPASCRRCSMYWDPADGFAGRLRAIARDGALLPRRVSRQ